MNTDNIQLEGSQPKYNLHLTLPSGLTMDDVDFTVKFFFYSSKKQTITKAGMSRVDKDNYTIVVDTSVIGYGSALKCEVDVELPDGDTESGFRSEKILIDVGEGIGHAM